MSKIKLEKKFHNIEDILTPGWKIDKIKIRYILRNIKEIQRIVDNLEIDSRILKKYESKSFEACKMNYIVETKDGNLYVGVGSNQTNVPFGDQQKIIVIEYNPNKIDAFKIAPYLETLITTDIHRREIMSIDMAYDMFIPITELEYKKRRINEYECRISHERLETIYLRKMGVNGSVRIYDKVLEMNGGNEEVEEETGEVKESKYLGNCTRYEIRIKPEKYKKEFNFVNPWLLEELVKLHEISIKEENQEKKILEEIYKYNGNDFTNLLTIHMGAERKLNDRAKKKYKEIYKEIKKMVLETNTKTNQIFKDFNTDKMLKPINDYLKNITTDNQNQILLHDILLH